MHSGWIERERNAYMRPLCVRAVLHPDVPAQQPPRISEFAGRAGCYLLPVTRALFQPFPMLPGRRAQVWRHQPAFHRPRHFHEEPEFNLVLRGSATLGVGDKIIHATRGDVVLFQPAQDHVLLEASADLDLFVVALRPDLAARACGPLVHACAQGCRLSEGETVLASEALRASADSGTLTDIETTLATLFRSLKARAAPAHVLSRLTVERVSADLEASGAHLAHLLRIDPSALSRHFHDDLSVRFVEYRARLRLISFVKRADEGTKLSRAAVDAGFGSYAQCHRVFTRVLGCSPRHYFNGKRREIDEVCLAGS